MWHAQTLIDMQSPLVKFELADVSGVAAEG
jgi:hypothetical protein